MLQGGKKWPFIGRGGAQVEDVLAHVGMRFRQGALQLRHLVIRLFQPSIRHPFTGGSHLQAGKAQDLSQTVMKLARQALALLEGCQGALLLEDLRLGAFLLGYIVYQKQPANP